MKTTSKHTSMSLGRRNARLGIWHDPVASLDESWIMTPEDAPHVTLWTTSATSHSGKTSALSNICRRLQSAHWHQPSAPSATRCQRSSLQSNPADVWAAALAQLSSSSSLHAVPKASATELARPAASADVTKLRGETGLQISRNARPFRIRHLRLARVSGTAGRELFFIDSSCRCRNTAIHNIRRSNSVTLEWGW